MFRYLQVLQVTHRRNQSAGISFLKLRPFFSSGKHVCRRELLRKVPILSRLSVWSTKLVPSVEFCARGEAEKHRKNTWTSTVVKK